MNVGAHPGDTVEVPVTLASTAQVSALQFDVRLPQGLSQMSAVAGPVAVAAQKTVSTGATPTGVRLVIFGVNQTAIGAGTVATLKLKVDAAATAGTLAVAVEKVVAASPSADAVQATVNAGSVEVTTP
jgi:hypothetical protein